MKFIKTFESHRNLRKKDKINEELLGIGKLFKNLKNKLSLGFSKMFGTASKVDELIEEYRKEVMGFYTKKNELYKQIVDMKIASRERGINNNEKIKQAINNLTQVSKNVEQQKDIAKKKFDLKVKDVTKDEKNPAITNYINLKKLEMESDILSEQSEILSKLSEDDLKSEFFKSLNDQLQNQAKKVQEAQTKESEIIKNSENVSSEEENNKAEDDNEETTYEQGDQVTYKKGDKELTGEVIEITNDKVKIKNSEGTEEEMEKTDIVGKLEYEKDDFVEYVIKNEDGSEDIAKGKIIEINGDKAKVQFGDSDPIEIDVKDIKGKVDSSQEDSSGEDPLDTTNASEVQGEAQAESEKSESEENNLKHKEGDEVTYKTKDGREVKATIDRIENGKYVFDLKDDDGNPKTDDDGKELKAYKTDDDLV